MFVTRTCPVVFGAMRCKAIAINYSYRSAPCHICVVHVWEVVGYTIVDIRQDHETAPRKALPSVSCCNATCTEMFDDEGQTTRSYN